MFQFESVTKRYRDGTVAVKSLDLTIPSDQVTVIVGPSGCGKTTTLRMINRMLEPTSGTITWDDRPLRSMRKTALRRRMGYVIQNGGLFPHRTVLDNVMTVPRLVGSSHGRARRRAIELLDAVGLDRRLARRYPAQLSGGQQQRVGVARALAADPQVLLMDEPFSAVDPVVRSDLHDLLLGLQAELHKTVIMITHDIDEAIKLGDRVVLLRVGGEVAQVGSPAELLNAPADDFVDGFVGRDRGYRSLSFTAADGLRVGRVRAVRDPASATGAEPTIVLGPTGRPVGWADGGRTLALGSTFDPAQDTLRAALDAALSSPVGLAVAVDRASGRYAGVVDMPTILDQVRAERAEFARERVASAEAERVEAEPVAEPAEAESAQVGVVEPAGAESAQVGVVEPAGDESAQVGVVEPAEAESVGEAVVEPAEAESVEQPVAEQNLGAGQEPDDEQDQDPTVEHPRFGAEWSLAEPSDASEPSDPGEPETGAR